MEIGIVSSRYPVGPRYDAGRAVHSFAHGLAALGHNVTVYTYNGTRTTTKHFETKNLKIVSIGVIASMPIRVGLIYEDAEAWNFGIWDEMEHEDTTKIIIVFDWFGFTAACQHRAAYGSLIIGIVSTLANGRGYFIPFTDPQKLADYKKKELEFLTHSDYLLAFNKCAAAEITKLTDVPHQIVSLGVEEVFHGDSTPTAGNVLIVGRISREKVLESFLRAIENNYWVDLTICSKGEDTDYKMFLSRLAIKLEVQNRIKFVEGPPEAYYRKAEMVVCPSIYDPFGYQVYDAFNYGVPVLGHFVSYADIIRNRDNGCLYQSMGELSKAMNSLHASRALRKELALSGKADLAEHYTKQRSIERMDHLLMQLTDGVYSK
jgi:glycosyltransferase involved in cell wall biosynthesis